MIKKITMFLCTLVICPCNGMQIAANQHNIKAVAINEAAAKKLIDKILAAPYHEMERELQSLSPEDKAFVKTVLDKQYSLVPFKVLFKQVLSGHSGELGSIAFSNDSHFALTGSADHGVRLWDLTQSPVTGQQIATHTSCVKSVGLSRDSRFALTSSYSIDRLTLARSDLSQPTIRHQYCTESLMPLVRKIAFNHDHLLALTCGNKNSALLCNLPAIIIKQLTGHTDEVCSVALSPDGQLALTGSVDRTARLWDLTKSSMPSTKLEGHDGLIASVAFSPCGHFALTGSWDGTARLWDFRKHFIFEPRTHWSYGTGRISCF